MGKVAKGEERRAASDGKEPLRPRAGGGHRMVPETPASVDPRAAHPIGREDAGPLRLLRHNGQHSTLKLVRLQRCQDLEELVVTAGSSEAVQLESLQRAP